MVTEKDSKKEIWAAYLQQQETILRLEKEAEQARGSISIMPENEITEMPAEKPGVTVVIPYVAKFAQGNELLMAVRGWANNFREEFNLVIIGDREPWMSDLVHVIECERKSDNPPIDIAHKMLLAIESDLVTEKFIWANDDQYLVSPCMLADFETLKCTGKLGEKNFGSNVYQENKIRTFELLKKIGRPTWDYSTHTPFVFEKALLSPVIDEFNLLETAHLVATLYLNFWYPDFVPYQLDTQNALFNDNFKAGVYRINADMNRLKELIPRKKVINNSQSGWSKQFSEIMKSCYPQMSRFENAD